MLTYAQLEKFYLELVVRAREAGVTCAITSGMACVHYGVAQTTKDCDLLCDPAAAETFLKIIDETELQGSRPEYRGNLSAPLDQRWLTGGWTSHFVWQTEESDSAYLDVFGVPPRASSPWTPEILGYYSGHHTVAEMKRTNREKDWPFATSLGKKMLAEGDERGWLHIFDTDELIEIGSEAAPPEKMVELRPLLNLVDGADRDELELAVRAEKEFWHQLDAIRGRVLRKALRSYVVAVKRDPRVKSPLLTVQHQARIEQATEKLPVDPLGDFGHEQMAEQAFTDAQKFISPRSARWLPETSAYLDRFVKSQNE